MEREIELSKKIAFALRHQPEKYGLTLDDKGFVSIQKLISAFRKESRWSDLSREEIELMIKNSEKKRYEIVDDKIRAYYGHSVPVKIIKEEKTPPDILYHGTDKRFLDSIMEQGLLSNGRQYVHLSQDVITADNVGKRRGGKSVILVIDSKNAYNNGIKFYYGGNDSIWLADFIPKEYISFYNKVS